MSTESDQTTKGKREGPATRKARGFLARRHERLNNNAVTREEVRASRSPEEQLALLDARLGPGMGATRERERLLAQISGRKVQHDAVSEPEVRRPKRAAFVAAREARDQRKTEKLDREIASLVQTSPVHDLAPLNPRSKPFFIS